MDKIVCTTCNTEREIIDVKESENRKDYSLSCGHKFIDLQISDTVAIKELFELKKIGQYVQKFKRGDSYG